MSMGTVAPHGAPQEAMAGLLLASLEMLARAGEVDAACRLAGEACAVVRGRDLAAWQRFNVFLHRMIKHLP